MPTAHDDGVRTDAIASNQRVTNLDTVRGVATLGILVMNAVSFGLPEAAYFNLDAAGGDGWLNRAVGIFGEIFVDQKTMALFSLLFGVGIVVFADRAESKGRRPVALSLWRNALLLAIGLLHTLVWEGDILTVYAICAPVLLALRRRRPRTLLIAGTTMVLTSAALAAAVQPSVSDAGSELGTFWLIDGGGVGDAVGLWLIADFFLRALGMMLVGVALYRMNVVQGTLPAATYQRMALLGLGFGIPLAVAGVVVQAADGYSPAIALVGQAPNTLATIPMALGYLALISLWNQRSVTATHLRIRAIGRMALTNYLTQTVIGIAVLRGLFDFGSVNRAGIWLLVLGVWALQLTWSDWWLSRFRFGPVEWAWRCATYRRLQPLRR